MYVQFFCNLHTNSVALSALSAWTNYIFLQIVTWMLMWWIFVLIRTPSYARKLLHFFSFRFLIVEKFFLSINPSIHRNVWRGFFSFKSNFRDEVISMALRENKLHYSKIHLIRESIPMNKFFIFYGPKIASTTNFTGCRRILSD